MNVILLTPIIFTLALVHGGGVFYKGNNITSNLAPKRSNPCQGRSEMSAHHNFSERHILPANFKATKKAWGKYLNEKGLCGRVPVQSFINNADEKNVRLICSDAGQRLQEVDDKRGNLCISKSTMSVYHVESKKNKNQCTIKVTSKSHPVIVACNKTENCCLPVHYEKYKNQKPGNEPCF